MLINLPPEMSVEIVYQGPYLPASPTFDKSGNLLFCCAASGLILKLAKDGNGFGGASVLAETNGNPSSLAIESQTGDILVADQARQAVLKLQSGAEGVSVSTFVDQYEGKQLRGPRSVTFDSEGEIIFCDSGLLGDSTLAHPCGAVYRTVHSGQQLVQLVPPSLAHPSAVVISPTGAMYVAELHKNRILRFVTRPAGVYHGSVFLQLSGGVGPSALAVHPKTGDLYIGKMDFAPFSNEGIITIVGAGGEEKQMLVVQGAEISGLCFDSAGKYLYITEQSRKCIYRVLLS
jgi:sugar lactone lactonase YvrE